MSETHVLGKHALRNEKVRLQREVDNFLSRGSSVSSDRTYLAALAERCEASHAMRALRNLEDYLFVLSGSHEIAIDSRRFYNQRAISTNYQRVMMMLDTVIWSGRVSNVSFNL